MNKFFIIILILTYSCNKEFSTKRDKLEIVLLNNNVKSEIVDYNSSPSNIRTVSFVNILEYYIHNNTDNVFWIQLPIKNEIVDYTIHFRNTIIQQENETIEYNGVMSDPIDIFFECYELYDEEFKQMYKQLGYKYPLIITDDGLEYPKRIVLHPGEKIYLESIIRLPGNCRKGMDGNSYVKLDSLKKYTFKLFFECDSTNIKKSMTKSELKTIQENNYKIFHGTLVSNAVPIKFMYNKSPLRQ